MANYPTLRLGRLASATNKDGKRVVFNFDQGESVITAIDLDSNRFHTVLREAAQKFPGVEKVVTASDNVPEVKRYGLFKARRSPLPGAVYDFDEFYIRLGKYDLSVRSCVTVCVSEKRDRKPEDVYSKLWVRVLCCGYDGVPVRDEDFDRATDFHFEAEKLGDALLIPVKAPYEKILSETLSTELSVKMQKAISVFAIEDDSIDFFELYDSASEGESFVELVNHNSAAKRLELLSNNIFAADSSSGDKAHLQDEFLIFKDIKLNRGAFLMRLSPDKVRIVGLAGDPTSTAQITISNDEFKPSRHSPASVVTAEVIGEYARGF